MNYHAKSTTFRTFRSLFNETHKEINNNLVIWHVFVWLFGMFSFGYLACFHLVIWRSYQSTISVFLRRGSRSTLPLPTGRKKFFTLHSAPDGNLSTLNSQLVAPGHRTSQFSVLHSQLVAPGIKT